MAAVNDQLKANVTINGNTVSVPTGRHSMAQLADYLGVPAATTLTVTDPAARSGVKYNPNMSVHIQGGETITSA